GAHIHGTFRLSSLILSSVRSHIEKTTKAGRCAVTARCRLQPGDDTMKRFPYLSRYPIRYLLSHALQLFALAAVALLPLSAITSERAEALSLINPGAVAAKKVAANDAMIEVHGGHGGGGGGHGGGHGGFGGGGTAAH